MVVSDTHRREANLAQALYDEGPIDMLIHLGDFEGQEDVIEEMAGCECIFVPGNNDFGSLLPQEREITIAGKKILLTHGHYYYVSLDLQVLRDECISRDIDIAMFGHTHRPLIQKEDNISYINPGSISFPRQEGRKSTYIMMEFENFEKNCEIRFTIKEL